MASEIPAFSQLPYGSAYWHEIWKLQRELSLPLPLLPMLVGDGAPSPLAETNPGWKQVSARLRRKNNLHGAENSPASWVFQPRGFVPKNKLEPLSGTFWGLAVFNPCPDQEPCRCGCDVHPGGLKSFPCLEWQPSLSSHSRLESSLGGFPHPLSERVEPWPVHVLELWWGKEASINESFQMVWLMRRAERKASAWLQECVHALVNELEAEGLANEPGLGGKGSRLPNRGDS